MREYEALIFDLDGTLWNVNQCCTDAWNKVLEGLGYEKRITLEEMNSVTGMPMDDIMKALLPEIINNQAGLHDLLNQMEEEMIGKQGTFVFPGVTEEIPELSKHFRLFMVSNCQEWYLLRFLEFSGIGRFLSGWDCYGKSGTEKHKMISVMKRQYNLRDAVYIGDMMLDKESADLSGTDFLQVTYGFGAPINGAVCFSTFQSLSEYLMKC